MENNVLAVVAGYEITEAELNTFLKGLPREQQMYASNPQFRQQCMEQLKALHMFAELGAEEKLDETEEYKKIMESARRDVLAQLAIRETMKNITVSEDEMKAYYEEHKEQIKSSMTIPMRQLAGILGEELISFGQFADYPDTPVYDEILFQGRTGKTLKIN